MTNVCMARDLTLHVFEQGDGWNWGLTVERSNGTGWKVIAYSGAAFRSEAQARADGAMAYDRMLGTRFCQS